MKRLLSFITVCVALLAAAAACGRHRYDASLERVYALSDSLPGEALAALDSIDPSALRDDDLQFYNLLRVKTADKNDRNISADSFITGVIEHFEHSGDARLYAEALYYGGRVSYEGGDYPTAIRHYQDALDILPDNDANLFLRGCIVSQTSSLLESVRLYSQAIPYMVQAIEISGQLRDTVNLARDYSRLGSVYMTLNCLDDAERYMNKALEFTDSANDMEVAVRQTYLAVIYKRKGDVGKALNTIRTIPQRMYPDDKNFAYSYASDIYLAAGIEDTAWMYAKAIIDSHDRSNKVKGYSRMLSPQLRRFCNKDSLDLYYNNYLTILKIRYNENDARAVMMQNSYYNYSQYERQNQRLAHQRLTYIYTIIGLVVSMLILLVIILRYRNLTLQKNNELNEALLDLTRLRSMLGITTGKSANEKSDGSSKDKRLELIHSIKELIKDAECPAPIPDDAKNSKIYCYINTRLENSKCIPDNKGIWDEIEKCVLGISSEFRKKLELLTGVELSKEDYRHALLMRLGFAPSQIAILLSRTKSGISYRRNKLYKRLLDLDITNEELDSIIRSI